MNLIRQKDDVTCGIACAAMVAGVSFDVARRKRRKPITNGISSREMSRLLSDLGVKFQRRMHPEIRRTCPHIITVPSLNVVGGMHYVVMFFDGRWNVLDPQRGRKGKKFYSRNADDPEGVPLTSFAEVIRILS